MLFKVPYCLQIEGTVLNIPDSTKSTSVFGRKTSVARGLLYFDEVIKLFSSDRASLLRAKGKGLPKINPDLQDGTTMV
jgi:hypothetical protein